MATTKKEKSGKGSPVGILIICVIVILIAVGFLGFRDGGWFRNKNKASDIQNMISLSDYAKQLEADGNHEAAEAVYELIAKNGDGDLVRQANEKIPVVKANNTVEQFKRFISGQKAGDAQ